MKNRKFVWAGTERGDTWDGVLQEIRWPHTKIRPVAIVETHSGELLAVELSEIRLLKE